MMNGLKNFFKWNKRSLRASLSSGQRASLLSGTLVGTSYIPFPPWAIFFAYVPLWLKVLRETSLVRVFFFGWVTQFVLTLIGFHWIAYTAYEFGHIPWPLSGLVLLAFASLAHLYIPLSIILAIQIRNWTRLSDSQTLVLLALTLILGERIWPSIFPWNLGYTFLWARWPIYQWADIVGFEGLSAFILLMNAAVAIAWLQAHNRPRVLLSLGFVGTLGIVALSVGGDFHGKAWKETDSSIKVLAVQGNIGNFEKIAAEKGHAFQSEILNRFLDLTRKGLLDHPETDLIFWPETAFPDFLDEFYKHRERPARLTEAIKTWKKPLLTGSFSKNHLDSDSNKNTFNAAFLISKEGERLGPPYHKTNLLAFGEYLPFSNQFPVLLKWITIVSNFGRGQGPSVFSWPQALSVDVSNTNSASNAGHILKIGPQICYEGLSPDFSRELARQGADLIANFTNDSWFGLTWFGYSFEPQQHMNMTLGRAIELRRPLIRATNTGITTAILADGTQLAQSPINEPWTGLLDIKFKKNSPQSFFVEHKNLDSWLYFVLFFVMMTVNWLKHQRLFKHKQTHPQKKM
ncbi:MAG: apolipoprotein N-acyltransferase [Bdellovibrionaceae bacterium]|nr:apolipoprotein N-acyltransferase [Pseudobdellovibrionaceae bacterium]